jgi:D-alanyl-lipoteichoic acid acyltransferase DltB (MBOAT superfamily)
MSSIALDSTLATGRREKAAAVLALPLGLMTVAGGIVFWEWSAWTFIAVIALAMGAAFLTGAVRVLRGDAAGARILLAAACTQVLFTIAKLVFWQETEAGLFGLVALVIAALLWSHRRG